MNFLLLFIALSIVNVVFSTVRSIATIKSGKTVASLLSGGYFAFYNIMLIYTVADFPLWQKCLITFFCNVIGVWVVKFVEERTRKQKLWKIEVSVRNEIGGDVAEMAESLGLSWNCRSAGEWAIFDFFCPNQESTRKVKNLLTFYDAKYFVSESKDL